MKKDVAYFLFLYLQIHIGQSNFFCIVGVELLSHRLGESSPFKDNAKLFNEEFKTIYTSISDV